MRFIILAACIALAGCASYFTPLRELAPIGGHERAFAGRTFEGWMTVVEPQSGRWELRSDDGVTASVGYDTRDQLMHLGVRPGERRYLRGRIRPAGICVTECHRVDGEGFSLVDVKLLRR